MGRCFCRQQALNYYAQGLAPLSELIVRQMLFFSTSLKALSEINPIISKRMNLDSNFSTALDYFENKLYSMTKPIEKPTETYSN